MDRGDHRFRIPQPPNVTHGTAPRGPFDGLESSLDRQTNVLRGSTNGRTPGRAGVASDGVAGPFRGMTSDAPPPATRARRQRRWLWLAGLGAAGVLAGIALAEMTVSELGRQPDGIAASPAARSANPDAATTGSMDTVAPCLDCRDSYAVAVRMRAERKARMDAAFRELGVVEAGADLPAAPRSQEPPDDGYRYGGRFPDAAPGDGAETRSPSASAQKKAAKIAIPKLPDAVSSPDQPEQTGIDEITGARAPDRDNIAN